MIWRILATQVIIWLKELAYLIWIATKPTNIHVPTLVPNADQEDQD